MLINKVLLSILSYQKVHLIYCRKYKSNKSSSDMTKIQIKSESITVFGVFFSIMKQFDVLLSFAGLDGNRREGSRSSPFCVSLGFGWQSYW